MKWLFLTLSIFSISSVYAIPGKGTAMTKAGASSVVYCQLLDVCSLEAATGIYSAALPTILETNLGNIFLPYFILTGETKSKTTYAPKSGTGETMIEGKAQSFIFGADGPIFFSEFTGTITSLSKATCINKKPQYEGSSSVVGKFLYGQFPNQIELVVTGEKNQIIPLPDIDGRIIFNQEILEKTKHTVKVTRVAYQISSLHSYNIQVGLTTAEAFCN